MKRASKHLVIPLLCVLAVTGCDRPIEPTAATLEDVESLTDQMVLAKVAIEHEDYDVRRAAVEKLTDQIVLEKSSRPHDDDKEIIAQFLAEIPAEDPRLKAFAGSCRRCESNAIEAIARIRLALAEPRILMRVPEVQLDVTVSDAFCTVC